MSDMSTFATSDRTFFPQFADTAQCWVRASDMPLSADQKAELLRGLRSFFESWTSHGRPVQAAATILDDRFLLIAGQIPDAEVSGCGIDKAVSAVEALSAELDISWAAPLAVVFRDAEGALEVVSRRTFKRLAAEGEVSPSTPVYDLSAATLTDLRDGFEAAAGESWHSRYF